MKPSYENIQLALGQKWLNQYCGDIPGYIPVPETGGYGTAGKTIIGVLTAIQKNIGVSIGTITEEYTDNSHIFGEGTKASFGDYTLSASTDFSSEYNLNMLKALQLGLWCKGKNPGDFGVKTNQLTIAINELMGDAGILGGQQDGVASRMIFIAISTEVDFTIPVDSNGDARTQKIQRIINSAYGKERGFLVPCDGIKAVSTIAGFLYYYQRTVGLSVEEAQNAYGLYNTQTYNLSQVLEEGSMNFLMVNILQEALYLINGYDSPTSGVFGTTTKNLIEDLQLSVGLPMTGIVDGLTWGYVLESCGYQEMVPTVCDTSMTLGPSEIQILKDNNITMVGRYLTGRFQMTPEEIKNITSANIAVIPIFEYGNKLPYFTKEQGVEDAQKAVLAAENLGIPSDKSVTIYFAVDSDFTLNDLEGNITEYFKGVFSKIAGAHIGYNIGVYGARYTCTYLLEKGYVTNSYVASSSYEFELNMGYEMPKRWGFNQYSTMNINEQGIAHGIYLDGVVPIDKVVASGYDKGVIRITQQGETTNVSNRNINDVNNSYIKQINTQNYPMIRETTITILSSLLNIKSTDLLKLIPRTLNAEGSKEERSFGEWGPWYIPGTNDGMYLRGDFGLKLQSASGSNGVIYLNKGDSKYSLNPSVDYLPVSFDNGNAYLGSNIHPKVLVNAESTSDFLKSVAPTLSETIFKYKNWTVGIQYYSCWDGNDEAEEGYYELGVEIGINTPTKEMPFIDVPYGAYFFIDIILGISTEAFKALLQKLDDNFNLDDGIFNLMNKLCDKIKSVPKTIASESDEEGIETEDMSFEGDSPEIFEDFGAFEESGGAEVEWELFGAALEAALPEALLILACF